MTIIPFPETKQGCGCKAPEWLRLPVASRAVARSRFSGEEKPPQAVPFAGILAWIKDRIAEGQEVAGLCLDGPGDPLADMELTLEMLAILQREHPSLPLGLTTLGLGLADQLDRLVEKGIKRVTMLVDAVTPRTITNLYAWIRPGRKNVPLAKAADILLLEQKKGIAACKESGIELCILTTVYSGVNETEVEEIAEKSAMLGAETMMLQPGQGWLADNEQLAPLPVDSLEWLAMKAGQHIGSVAVEMPGSSEIIPLAGMQTMSIKPTEERPNVAVLSSNGMDIDLHLGQAVKALIYGPREDGLACLLEARDLPEPGSGDNRWLQLAGTLQDCFVLLAASAGKKPRDILGRQGIPLLLIEDNVEGTVDALYGGGKKKGKRA